MVCQLELAPTQTPSALPTPLKLPQTREEHLSRGNDLIFFCDVDTSGKLNCRWIKACLI